MLDLCKGKRCPIKKQCARYNPGGRGFFFHPQWRDGDCILFIPRTTAHHTSSAKKDQSCSLSPSV